MGFRYSCNCINYWFLIGPTVGGYIESILGLKSTFIITGGLLFVSFIISILFVVDNFKPKEIKESISTPKKQLDILPNKFLIASIFVTTFVTQLALYSIEPIVTIYIYHSSQILHQM
nr:MFS transporter [Clostridioides difficile]